MQPFIYVIHLGSALNEVFDNIDLIATPRFESLRIVSDHLAIPFKFDLYLDVMDAPLFARDIMRQIQIRVILN
jgi:hypothetical protein